MIEDRLLVMVVDNNGDRECTWYLIMMDDGWY